MSTQTRKTKAAPLCSLIDAAKAATDRDTLADRLIEIVDAMPQGSAFPEAARNALRLGIMRLAADVGLTKTADDAMLADARTLHDAMGDLHARMGWHSALAATIEHVAQDRDLHPPVILERVRTLAGLARYLGDDAEGIADSALSDVPASRLWPRAQGGSA